MPHFDWKSGRRRSNVIRVIIVGIIVSLGPVFATNAMRKTIAIIVLTAMLSGSTVAVHTVRGEIPPVAAPAPGAPIDADGIEFFEKNIRPVLAEHCFACHAVGAIKLRGNLLLDSRQGVVKGGQGGPVIVAGEPDKSRLIQAIRWTDPNFQMPPTKKLSPEQIEKFEQWVKMGAPDPRDDASERGDQAAHRGGGRPHVVGTQAGRAARRSRWAHRIRKSDRCVYCRRVSVEGADACRPGEQVRIASPGLSRSDRDSAHACRAGRVS